MACPPGCDSCPQSEGVCGECKKNWFLTNGESSKLHTYVVHIFTHAISYHARFELLASDHLVVFKSGPQSMSSKFGFMG